MDDDSPIFFLVIIMFALGFFTPIIFLSHSFEKTIEVQTVIYCIEKPKDCKTKYDFYKLKDTKGESK